MRQSRPLYLILASAVLVAMLTVTAPAFQAGVFAQVPAAETETPQPTEPPTNTPLPTATSTTAPTNTPGATATGAPTNTPGATATTVPTATAQPPAPVTIPEPITVVLFGTGLAALSAAAASRRKNDGKDDGE